MADSVVLPSPGGPWSSRWSRASPRGSHEYPEVFHYLLLAGEIFEALRAQRALEIAVAVVALSAYVKRISHVYKYLSPNDILASLTIFFMRCSSACGQMRSTSPASATM